MKCNMSMLEEKIDKKCLKFLNLSSKTLQPLNTQITRKIVEFSTYIKTIKDLI